MTKDEIKGIIMTVLHGSDMTQKLKHVCATLIVILIAIGSAKGVSESFNQEKYLNKKTIEIINNASVEKDEISSKVKPTDNNDLAQKNNYLNKNSIINTDTRKLVDIIKDHTLVKTENESVVKGTIVNSTGSTIGPVKVIAEFKDEGGVVVDKKIGFATGISQYLAPQAMIGFSIPPTSKLFADYSLTTEYDSM